MTVPGRLGIYYHSRDHVTQQSAGDLRPKIWQDTDTAHPPAEKHCDGYSFHYSGLAIQDLADARTLLNLAR
jgi:hypothetical protein